MLSRKMRKLESFFSDKLSCSLNNDLAIDPKNLSLESYPCLFFCFSPISGRDCHTLLDVYGSILLRLCATKAFTFPNSGGLCGALAPSYCLAKVYSRDAGIQSVNSLIFPHPGFSSNLSSSCTINYNLERSMTKECQRENPYYME